MPLWETISKLGFSKIHEIHGSRRVLVPHRVCPTHGGTVLEPSKALADGIELSLVISFVTMSPTCTIPYEVLLEFINDSPDCVTLQVFRQEDGTQTGAMLLIHEGESISLVLTAGCLYQYGLRQRGKEVNVS